MEDQYRVSEVLQSVLVRREAVAKLWAAFGGRGSDQCSQGLYRPHTSQPLQPGWSSNTLSVRAMKLGDSLPPLMILDASLTAACGPRCRLPACLNQRSSPDLGLEFAR